MSRIPERGSHMPRSSVPTRATVSLPGELAASQHRGSVARTARSG